MISVQTPNVNVKNKVLLLLDNFSLKELDLKLNYRELLKSFKQLGINFLKTAPDMTTPLVGMAVGAKTKNPQVAQATTNILKTVSAGKLLRLTNMHGHGLQLRVT